MTPDNPFLAALLADPDDDTLRLALADWLDETGDAPRAEFVRVQIELARGVADLGRRRELEVRQSQLLVAHDAAWVAPLAKVLKCKRGRWGGWVFRRGFVEYFRLRTVQVANRGAGLARLTPVRQLYFDDGAVRDPGVSLAALWRQPWVASLTHVYNLWLDPPTAEAMIQSPHLGGLRSLTARGEVTDVLWRRFQEKFARALGR